MFKKSAITVLGFIALTSQSIFADCCPNPVNVTTLCRNFEISLEALYLRPTANNLGWAVITNFLPVVSPSWEVIAIDPDFQFGFDLGMHYFSPCHNVDLALNWTHLHTHDTDHVSVDPSMDPTSQWVSPFSQTGTPPEDNTITGIAKLKNAEADLRFDYDAVHLDVGKYVELGCNMRIRLFSGLSGVYIKEELFSTFSGIPLPVLSIYNTSWFKGVGPRLGVTNSYDIYHGLNLICELAGSLLIGRMQPAQYEFAGSSEALALVGIETNYERVASDSVTQMVPAFDGKIGLGYSYHFCRSLLTFEAGYREDYYISPLSGYETATNVLALDIGSLSTSSVDSFQSNFAVGGFYLQVAYAF